MKKTINKNFAWLLVVALIGLIVGVIFLSQNNSSWQSTIEEAWEYGRDEFEKDETEIFETIDLIYYEEAAVLIFITEEGNLVEADFEFNPKKEKWHCYSIGQYGSLTEIEEKWSTYELEGERMYNMLKDGTTLSGMRYHDGKIPYVNGTAVNLRTYSIIFQGITYQIDYWDVKDFDENLFDEIVLTYQNQ